MFLCVKLACETSGRTAGDRGDEEVTTRPRRALQNRKKFHLVVPCFCQRAQLSSVCMAVCFAKAARNSELKAYAYHVRVCTSGVIERVNLNVASNRKNKERNDVPRRRIVRRFE